LKKRISQDIRWIRFVFIAPGAAALYGHIKSIIDKGITLEGTIITLMILTISVLVYLLLDHARKVEFDKDFMYLTGKTLTEKIPLENVVKIKLTKTKLNNQNMWKIAYLDQKGKEKSVRVLPRWFDQHFDEFKKQVQNANPSAKIQNWSHPFDFDQ
jgi:hypothetical protein